MENMRKNIKNIAIYSSGEQDMGNWQKLSRIFV